MGRTYSALLGPSGVARPADGWVSMFTAPATRLLVVRNVTLHAYEGARSSVIYDDGSEQPLVEFWDPGAGVEACRTFWYRHIVLEGQSWVLSVDNPHGGSDPFVEFYSSGYNLSA